ncbi:unnamed protein product [Dimorphilus gyrociliatus]|uniref:SOCS box domain-containing protein n=1 Tax=Dimorphilus gyrociliatus TaxID=2664684 RepID=A0A7I8VHR1_9ANNE|nr:unnamed protein product [Dimorphilus gyrociliatus]
MSVFKAVIKSIEENDSKKLHKLLQRKSTLNLQDLNEALLFAASNGKEACIIELLDVQVDPNSTDLNNKTALQLLLEKSFSPSAKCVRYLIRAGCNAPSVLQLALHISSRRGFSACVQTLLDNSAPIDWPDEVGNTPLICAAKEGRTAIVDILLDAGCDANAVNNEGQTALHVASKRGHISTVRALLDLASPDVLDVRCETPFLLAAKYSHAAIVEELLASGVDLQVQDKRMKRTPIMWACVADDLATIQILLSSNVNLESRDVDWKTALLLSAEYGNGTSTNLLLPVTDISAVDVRNEGVLHKASKNKYFKLQPYFTKLVKRTEVDVKAEGGRSPLMFASFYCQIGKIESLIVEGANPNLTDRYGANSLMYSVLSGGYRVEDVVKMLIRANSNLDIRSNVRGLAKALNLKMNLPLRTLTIGELALLREEYYVIQLLLTSGANVWKISTDDLIHYNPNLGNGLKYIKLVEWFKRKAPELKVLCRKVVLQSLKNTTMIRELPVSEQTKRFLKYQELDSVVSLEEKESGKQNYIVQKRSSPRVSINKPLYASSIMKLSKNKHSRPVSMLEFRSPTAKPQAPLRSWSTSAVPSKMSNQSSKLAANYVSPYSKEVLMKSKNNLSPTTKSVKFNLQVQEAGERERRFTTGFGKYLTKTIFNLTKAVGHGKK